MQAFAIAAAGIAGATDRFAASAVRTARDPMADVPGEMVERLSAEAALKANVSVLKSADDMYGSLLDILA
jgi:flagellar basal body rod protein FlgC